jgi:hypothetical protein
MISNSIIGTLAYLQILFIFSYHLNFWLKNEKYIPPSDLLNANGLGPYAGNSKLEKENKEMVYKINKFTGIKSWMQVSHYHLNGI